MSESDKPFFYGANAEIFKRASELRKRMTKAEEKLWAKVRGKQICGLRFRRQHPIANYIVDFYCHPTKLVIEIDGDIHLHPEVIDRDKVRDENLQKLGLTVLHFSNEQIEKEIESVLNTIRNYCC